MALDKNIREQLVQYLELLESDLVFHVSLGEGENSEKVSEFLEEIVSLSPRLSIVEENNERKPSFSISKPGEEGRVRFAGLPLGHEFTSLVLAILQVSGRAPKVDDDVIRKIQSVKETYHFETYVSLTCHNCPDVVQALNIMSILNPNISHTMIEGGMFKEEIDARKIMAVPTVFLNGDEIASGRMSIEQLLEFVAASDVDEYNAKETYDVLVIGGGPAGNSAAIYASRKGIRAGMVVETYGGQVMETVGIENMIGTSYTEGPKLMASVEEHAKHYPIDIMKGQRVVKVEKKDFVEVTLKNGAMLKAKAIVLALGAKWRNINVPGEEEFRKKGVTYCPHCDGPLFEGENVAVVGGGNSGIEAAIDLSGLAKHVTVFEFLPQLKADRVLQDRANSISNITIHTNVAVQEIKGDSQVEQIRYMNRETNESFETDVKGVFVQIGLVPSTDWLKESGVELNDRGEIKVDSHGATNIPGIYAAGDCTDSAYKQIIISMGSGATAALGAFDYLIRL